MTPATEPAGRAVNPFLAPGTVASQVGDPLAFHGNSDHHQYFVDVDDLPSLTARFSDKITAASVLRQGWLVTVSGNPGSGKSTLINWCADKAESVLREAGYRPLVIDLSSTDPGAASFEDRGCWVAARIVASVLGHDDFAHEDPPPGLGPDRPPGAERPGALESFHRIGAWLDRLARTRTRTPPPVLVVILPESDSVNEVSAYVRRILPGLLLLLETHDQYTRRSRQVLPLSIGPITQDDAWRFVLARLTLVADSAGGRPLTPFPEENLRKMVNDDLNLRMLRRYLYYAFEDAISQPEPPQEITTDYVVGHHRALTRRHVHAPDRDGGDTP
jgi:hypothetical protein